MFFGDKDSVKKTILGIVILLSACGASTSNQPDPFHGIAVPPEPNVAANSTLLGVDSNNNGVRDDVERKIAIAYGANVGQFKAAIQSAKSDQEYLVANGDPIKSTSATSNAVIAGACITDKFNTEWLSGSKAINYLSPLTFNTPERMAAYRATVGAPTD